LRIADSARWYRLQALWTLMHYIVLPGMSCTTMRRSSAWHPLRRATRGLRAAAPTGVMPQGLWLL
jgi:hypothetical protein